ncbi:MAG: hypothetical protein ABSF47_03025 [Minisyncoccia bacterium]|jgi:hypothetical protein
MNKLIVPIIIVLVIGGLAWSYFHGIRNPQSQGLTLEQIQKTEYALSGMGAPFTFDVNGQYKYFTYMGKGGNGEPNVTYTATLESGKIALGDLNGDGKKDAVIPVVENLGGNGFFEYLVVFLDDNGQPKQTATQPLGDRIVINSINIKDGQVVVDMIDHGPNDGMCCPTLSVTKHFKLQGVDLIEATSTAISADTSDWKTYLNNKYGYGVNYPKDWYAFVPVFQDRTVNPTGKDENIDFGSINLLENKTIDATYQNIYIDRENGSYYADSKTVDDFWNKLGKTDDKGNLANKFKEERFINGEYFVLFDQYGWEVRVQKYLWSPQAVFMHGGNIFWVRPSFNVSEELFNSFLSTFKFISPGSNIDTSTWQIYRNVQYEFEVKYPAYLTATEPENGNAINPNIVYITNLAQGKSDTDQPADRLLIKINPDTKCALKDWKKGFGDIYWKTACIDGNPNYFVVMSALTGESQQVLDQILSTFKFTSQIDTSGWQTYRNEQYGFEFKYSTPFPNIGRNALNSELGTVDNPVGGIYFGPLVFVVLQDEQQKTKAESYFQSVYEHGLNSSSPIQEQVNNPYVQVRLVSFHGGSYAFIKGEKYDVFMDGSSGGFDKLGSDYFGKLSHGEMIGVLSTFKFISP